MTENSQDQPDSTRKPLTERLKNLIPSVKKIVYSTCSVYAQENEHVVKRALEQTNIFELADKKDVMPSWPRRGIASEMSDNEEAAGKLVRSIPDEDYTNGFFVACFIRKPIQDGDGERNGRNAMANNVIKKSKKRKR
ncbi:11663_t:CDS:2, partial [Acaulospora colombiana]